MSSISSSKSHLSGAGYDEAGGAKAMFDMQQQDNPFALPPDEKIFTFKEEQKHSKLV